MSGLAGIISSKKSRKNRGKTNMLLERISHRGRKRKIYDFCGNYIGINTKYGLNNRVNGKIILIDGKIYNLDSLLLKYNIKSDRARKHKLFSDIKKINLLFDIAGEEIFKEFRGSFALIFADSNGDIYIARDVIGRRPLYYLKNNKDLMFASEIKSLINFGADICELPPGSCMLNFENPKIIKKIDTEDFPVIEGEGGKELEEKLENYLLKSMDRRISSNNLKYGVWLSGGLDSSIIAAMLKEFTDKVYTYSVGFENSPDILSARRVADYLGTRHTEYRLDTEELFSSIPRVIYHLESFDAPLVRSSLGNMIVSKISESSDVVFSGEGGDELFAGYNYFLKFNSSKLIQDGLVKAINSLHNTALQRVDRTANAYSINMKLPILDESLLDFVLRISPEMKVRKDKNTGKYILRKVASRYLPEDIIWREKDKFWEGSGIEDTLEKKIYDIISDEEFIKAQKLPGNIKFRNKEELYYYRIFNRYYSNVDFNKVISFTEDFN